VWPAASWGLRLDAADDEYSKRIDKLVAVIVGGMSAPWLMQ